MKNIIWLPVQGVESNDDGMAVLIKDSGQIHKGVTVKIENALVWWPFLWNPFLLKLKYNVDKMKTVWNSGPQIRELGLHRLHWVGVESWKIRFMVDVKECSKEVDSQTSEGAFP